MTNSNEVTEAVAKKTAIEMLDDIVHSLAFQLDEARQLIANQISDKEMNIINSLSSLEKKLFVELHLSTVEDFDPYLAYMFESEDPAEAIATDDELFYRFHASVNYRIALCHEIDEAAKK